MSFSVTAVSSAFVVSLACGQTNLAADAAAPKLSDHFTFTLGPQRGHAVSELVKTLTQHDELLRAKELEDANATVFSRVLDLLRFVPIKFNSSASNDFFTPNHLRPGYTGRPEPHLFDDP